MQHACGTQSPMFVGISIRYHFSAKFFGRGSLQTVLMPIESNHDSMTWSHVT